MTPRSGERLESDEENMPPVRGRIIALLILATFGTAMAAIVPMSFSLAVRIEQLAPGRSELLGLALGAGAAATLVVAPLSGQLSDRTRSRWGRRRPYTVVGALLGAATVPLLALAPSVPALIVAWTVATAAWNTASGSVANWQAEHLAPVQRGKVAGFTGLIMQVAPVVGIALVGLIPNSAFFVFGLPAGAALLLLVPFVLFADDPDSRDLVIRDRLTVGRLLRSYTFSPRAFPDFSWNWFGRFLFFIGIMLTASFTVVLYAQRLGLDVADVAGLLALSSGLSVATASVGALGGGWVSDRIGRRRPVIFAGAVGVALGATLLALAHDVVSLIAGTLVMSTGIALFSAPAQALTLDVLPNRATEAGRYMAITLFSQKIPGTLAPLAAPVILGIGTTAGTLNFTMLYLIAGGFALLGGAVVCFGVRGAR